MHAAGGRSQADLPETRSTSEEAAGVGGAAVPRPASRAAERLGHGPGRHHQASVQLPDRCVYTELSHAWRRVLCVEMRPSCLPLLPLDGSKV